MNHEAYLVDTETTDKKDGECIELACYALTPSCELGEGFALRYKPSKPIAWGAMATHHILPHELEACPPHTQARKDLPAMTYMVGHNIDFDWKVLGEPPVKRICTLALARYVWPKLDSHSLSAVLYYVSSDKEGAREMLRGAHSAHVDVHINQIVLRHIIEQTKVKNIQELWELSELARIPTIMPFGKYRDEPISRVDKGYAMWYSKQPDTDPYILIAFRKAGLLK